jgi:hypothetical protein
MGEPIDWRKPQPLPSELGRVLRAEFPMITATGIFNDRNIAGTNKKSAHAEGRAIDIHLKVSDPTQRMVGDRLFDILIAAADVQGADSVIWNKQIWSTRHRYKRPYSGQNPHTDHIHVEFTRAGSQTRVVDFLQVKLAQLRTGVEELSQAYSPTA